MSFESFFHYGGYTPHSPSRIIDAPASGEEFNASGPQVEGMGALLGFGLQHFT